MSERLSKLTDKARRGKFSGDELSGGTFSLSNVGMLDVDELVVSEAHVNEGPRMKRLRPAPMGRAFRYQRRMAHIAVTVSAPAEEEEN